MGEFFHITNRIWNDYGTHRHRYDGNCEDGKFEDINDVFYREMETENYLSRFKIYIAKLVKQLDYKEDMLDELSELKKIRKNIGSVITTNYDNLIEDVFGR